MNKAEQKKAVANQRSEAPHDGLEIPGFLLRPIPATVTPLPSEGSQDAGKR